MRNDSLGMFGNSRVSESQHCDDKAQRFEMPKLSDSEIIPNYAYRGTGSIDRGEELTCNRCGAHSIEPGVRSHGWGRTPNQATNLPSIIALCDKCNKEIAELKQLGR